MATTPIVFSPPPVRTRFADDRDKTGSGISWPWLKFFQDLFTQIQQGANSGGILSANSGALPVLTPAQAGTLVNVTNFGHLLRWNGTNYEWGPGDPGSGYIAGFMSAPTQQGWHICDGSTVNQLNSDGSTTSVTLPDYTGNPYLKLGTSLVAGPNAESGLTDPVSAGTPSGTNSVPVFTGIPSTSGAESADQVVAAGVGANVPAVPHTHDTTAAGTVSAPIFTGSLMAPHQHGPGTLDLRNTQLQGWFRQ